MNHDITELRKKVDALALEAAQHGWELKRVHMQKLPLLKAGDEHTINVEIHIEGVTPEDVTPQPKEQP